MTEAALAQFQNRQLHVEQTGQTTTVPDDNVARLMYYLSCISCILDNCVPSNLTNYSQYYRLDSSDRMLVIRLAVELSPDKVPVFVEVDSLPDGSSNEFLKFSSLEETITALGIRSGDASVMALRRQVGDKQELIKVMAYTPAWIRRNYLNPLMAIKREIEQLNRPAVTYYRPQRSRSQCCTIL